MTEQVTTNEEPTITIDDVTHNLSDLSQEAQQCVSQITSLDKQVQATQFQLQQQSGAREFFISQLKSAIDTPVEEAEVVITFVCIQFVCIDVLFASRLWPTSFVVLLSLYFQGLAERKSMAKQSRWQKRSPGSLISYLFSSILCLHPGYGLRPFISCTQIYQVVFNQRFWQKGSHICNSCTENP